MQLHADASQSVTASSQAIFPDLSACQALLLDFDGTLVDSVDTLKVAYYELLQGHGLQGSEVEFYDLIGPSLRQIAEVLHVRHGISQSGEALYRVYLSLLMQKYAEEISAAPGAQELLDAAFQSGIKLAIVSSSPLVLIDCFRSANRWSHYFAATVSGDDVKVSKPQPEIYLLALERLSTGANNALAVEDSTTGVLSASRAGISTIGILSGVNTASELLNAGATTCISSLSELATRISSRVD